MTLELTLAQRINLIELINQTPAVSVGEIRWWWKFLDKVAVTPEEASAIDLQETSIGPAWNTAKEAATPPSRFEFSELEFARLRNSVAQAKLPTAARPWLEPLLDQLEV
jgi:hypothetical protein